MNISIWNKNEKNHISHCKSKMYFVATKTFHLFAEYISEKKRKILDYIL